MRQVFRRVLDKKGQIRLEEVPAPGCGPDRVLVASRYSVISAGTEGATLGKTFPELVRQTLKDPWMRNAVKNLLLGASPETIKNIVLDEITQLRAIGYSGSGIAIEVGENVRGIKPGDGVAFAAQGHAEIVAPSANLTIPVPAGVELKDAAFVTLGGIAMQGVRRAEIELGEQVAVIGLGLVGQMVAQLVQCAGGHVLGVDINEKRLDELKALVPRARTVNSAALDPVQPVLAMTGGYGADAVIICASSRNPAIANQAMKMCRKQGRVVFVGLVTMELERMPFFLNELDLRFSRAYGPGSYDSDYEKGRIDYPRHYIRWTEQRNLAEFLALLQEGRVRIGPMIGGVFPVEQAQAAYDKINDGTLGGLAALIEYPNEYRAASRRITGRTAGLRAPDGSIRVGVIGCGNFTRGTHLPNLYGNRGFFIKGIATETGAHAASLMDRFKIGYSTTDYMELLADPDIDAVLITTRHHLHGRIACAALAAGKHVLVEKPAVLTREEHQALRMAVECSDRVYMVGYNRRHSPLALELARHITAGLPMIVQYQACVPEIPADHWTLHPTEGGGRLIGEAEHFFDFINFLTGDTIPASVTARCLRLESQTVRSQYNFSVDLTYGDAALGTVTYTSYADPSASREKITIHQGKRTMVLDNFRTLIIQGTSKRTWKNRFADMGHKAELDHFAAAIRQRKANNVEALLAASSISLQALEWLEQTQTGKGTFHEPTGNLPWKE